MNQTPPLVSQKSCQVPDSWGAHLGVARTMFQIMTVQQTRIDQYFIITRNPSDPHKGERNKLA